MNFIRDLLEKKQGKQPHIDKKIITKAYEEEITPLLNRNGFNILKGRVAWRHGKKKIDVIELQFFPKAKTSQWGITPFSFALPIGCFFPFMPPFGLPVKKSGDLLLPTETNCHIRKITLRTIKQQGTKIPNVWHIEAKGKNLHAAIEDAKQVLEKDALPWFERLNDLEMILKALLEPDPIESLHKKLNAIGGVPGQMPGFFALELGKWQLAHDLLRKVLNDRLQYSASRSKPLDSTKTDNKMRILDSTLDTAIEEAIAKANLQLHGKQHPTD